MLSKVYSYFVALLFLAASLTAAGGGILGVTVVGVGLPVSVVGSMGHADNAQSFLHLGLAILLFSMSCLALLIYAGIYVIIKKAAAYSRIWKLTLLGAFTNFIVEHFYPWDGFVAFGLLFILLFLFSLPLKWLQSPALTKASSFERKSK